MFNVSVCFKNLSDAEKEEDDKEGKGNNKEYSRKNK
jgi:hypothetical protein